MKYILPVALFVLAFHINPASAQLAFGAGLAFTSNTNDAGVQLKSQFSFGRRWRAEGFVDMYMLNNKREFYGDANLNGHYVFTDVGNIEIHASLGGVVFFGRTTNLGFISEGKFAGGINVGTGLQYEINSNFNGYLDVIFTFTDFHNPNLANRMLFTLGAIYELNKSSD